MLEEMYIMLIVRQIVDDNVDTIYFMLAAFIISCVLNNARPTTQLRDLI